MAEIIEFRKRQRTDAESCAEIYARMKFETSNVAFAPAFCLRAQEVYDQTGGPVDDVA